MSKELPEITQLGALERLMRQNQVHTLVYKRLAPNDNSKNQIYLGGNYSALQLLPIGNVNTDESRNNSKRDRFKADILFEWMDNIGNLYPAPSAQLILYPKYPEVRMSGFLKGAQKAPSNYLGGRDEGRVMILGITSSRHIIGHVIGPENPLSRELAQFDNDRTILSTVYQDRADDNAKRQLLEKLREIHMMGWVNSCKLDGNGNMQPYKAVNGGGYTLEALLGVLPNGRNEPDYLGWEIKQHKAKLDNPLSGGTVTLMTPEPTGGTYKLSGIVKFIQQFGYPDKSGIPDRMNFGGVHKFGEQQNSTSLTLKLVGYDAISGKITDTHGGIALVSDNGEEAAKWHFSSLLEKWNKKHAQAAYISSKRQTIGSQHQYMYGHTVALGTGTDFSRFLSAIAKKSIYYDPGIKVENISTRPKAKKRSQFRIKSKHIPELYETMDIVNFKTT